MKTRLQVSKIMLELKKETKQAQHIKNTQQNKKAKRLLRKINNYSTCINEV